MKYLIEKLVRDALGALPEELRLPDTATGPVVERTRDSSHGDFATNVALQLAKAARRKPRELAQALIDALPASELVARVGIAGPGFINFFLAPAAYQAELLRVIDGGRSSSGRASRASCTSFSMRYFKVLPSTSGGCRESREFREPKRGQSVKHARRHSAVLASVLPSHRAA